MFSLCQVHLHCSRKPLEAHVQCPHSNLAWSEEVQEACTSLTFLFFYFKFFLHCKVGSLQKVFRNVTSICLRRRSGENQLRVQKILNLTIMLASLILPTPTNQRTDSGTVHHSPTKPEREKFGCYIIDISNLAGVGRRPSEGSSSHE